eukprot:3894198-Rhodomonas_salina.1
MNEHEDAAPMLEAILKTNRYAARHKDRFSALPLHYACRSESHQPEPEPTARILIDEIGTRIGSRD